MTTAHTNPYEQLARQDKARKLVNVLKKAGATAEQVAAMSNDAWLVAASIADVKVPSDETRAAVVAMLTEDAHA